MADRRATHINTAPITTKMKPRAARAMSVAKPEELQVETAVHGPAIASPSMTIHPKRNRITPTMLRVLELELA
jgi:hypothetical protein